MSLLIGTDLPHLIKNDDIMCKCYLKTVDSCIIVDWCPYFTRYCALLFGLLLGLLIVHVYIKIADCININIYRYVSPMGVWAYGHIGIWAYDIWAYGHMGV
jgi:hypothetical protein